MSDNNGSDKGVHYHYHFYGYGAGQQPQDQNGGYAPAAEQQATDATGFAPQQQAPGQANGQAPGAVPPGFPFQPGAPFPPQFAQQAGAGQYGAGQAGAGQAGAGQAGAAPGGFNWHQHPSADSLIKGLAIGAGAAYLLTNETAQRTILRSAVQVWSLLQNGIEELKERIQDAEAEVAAAAEPAEENVPSTTSGS